MNDYSRGYYKKYKRFNVDRVADFIIKNVAGFFKEEHPSQIETAADIGCGIGGLTYRLRDCSKSAVGIDLSLDALKLAKKYNDKKLFFIQGSALMLPLKDGSCDLCACVHVIEHIREPETLLKEIYRVISDNGRLVFITPNKRWTRFCLPFLKDKTHVKEFSMVELKALVSGYFHIEGIKPDICVFAIKK